ncbi:MAG: glycosyltransferase family 39 protein [Alphaproteobacteria bacterium]|nr:glycosyltransferase family 39 protein [Alphaproteobacteria bacterium]
MFLAFLFTHMTIWTFLPLLRQNAPLDSIEAILWGYNGGWGFDKHPPLSGWLADWSYQILPPDLSIYLLSQIVIGFGFFFIWKLAKKVLQNPQKEFWSVLLLEGVLSYSFFSPEFNVNILLLGLVPALFYFFYESIFERKTYSAILFGIFCALAMLTKYIAGVFLVACLFYMIFTKKGRGFLFSWRIIPAGIAFLGLFIPHFIWMINTDFITITYAMNRATKDAYSILNHIKYPIIFFVGQIGTVFGLLLTIFTMKPKRQKYFSEEHRFIVWMTLAPLVLTLLPAILFGMKLKTMWGVPLFGLFPLFFFTYFNIQITKTSKWFLSIFITLVLVSYIGITLFHISKRSHFPGRELAENNYKLWGKEPLLFVGGDMWLAGNVAMYHPQGTLRPKTFVEMNPNKNPNLDLNDFKTNGGIIFAFSKKELETYLKDFPNAKILPPEEYLVKNILAETKTQTIWIGIAKPKKVD